jgi:hypothetical protein
MFPSFYYDTRAKGNGVERMSSRPGLIERGKRVRIEICFAGKAECQRMWPWLLQPQRPFSCLSLPVSSSKDTSDTMAGNVK